MQLLKETISEWSEDKVPRLAAALAYYTAFALAPLLLIAISVAGLVFGREAATNQIGQQLAGLLGPSAPGFVIRCRFFFAPQGEKEPTKEEKYH